MTKVSQRLTLEDDSIQKCLENSNLNFGKESLNLNQGKLNIQTILRISFCFIRKSEDQGSKKDIENPDKEVKKETEKPDEIIIENNSTQHSL